MTETDAVTFDTPAESLIESLHRDPEAVPFGAIGLGADLRVRTYNARESREAGLAPERVLGKPMFAEVAPCMDNALVGERFVAGGELDETLDYLLTLRMRPTRVRLRLLARPSDDVRWILVQRLSRG